MFSPTRATHLIEYKILHMIIISTAFLAIDTATPFFSSLRKTCYIILGYMKNKASIDCVH